MSDMLRLTQGLPEVGFAPGQTIVREGDVAAGVWVLVSGHLQVEKGGAVINAMDRPGALVGEVSVLLDAPCSATVTAIAPSVLRHAADGRALLLGEPSIMMLVAMGLAERLHFVTTYLADLKHQYGDAPGLAMVPDVMRHLAQLQVPTARPGSARDPDPDY